MAIAELLPCPICGGEAECNSVFSSVHDEIKACVKCKHCGLVQWYKGVDAYDLSGESDAAIARYHEKAKKIAVKGWNKRKK